jgi:hypothetical protein
LLINIDIDMKKKIPSFASADAKADGGMNLVF